MTILGKCIKKVGLNADRFIEECSDLLENEEFVIEIIKNIDFSEDIMKHLNDNLKDRLATTTLMSANPQFHVNKLST